VHAHTGVMSHLMAPRDARMVARCRVGVPAHASEGRGIGGEGRGREMFHVKQSGGKWSQPFVVPDRVSDSTGTTYTPYIYYRYRMYR